MNEDGLLDKDEEFNEKLKDVNIYDKNKKKRILTLSIIIGVVVLIIAFIILCCALTYEDTDPTPSPTNEISAESKEKINSKTINITINDQTITYSAVYIIAENTTINEGEYNSTNGDENVFLVINGSTLIINDGVKINKVYEGNEPEPLSGEKPPDYLSRKNEEDPPEISGENPPGPSGSDSDNYNFYGTNSAIVVVGRGSKAIINGVEILTKSYGANAVVAVDDGKIEIKNSTIYTEKDSSRGLHATYKGVIEAENINITTLGASCANLATDRGEGFVTAYNMHLSTFGKGSPLIYSTGIITVYNSEGTSNGAQISVIEGKNSAEIVNCEFRATGNGNRGNVDECGVMIYQSMSEDALEGKGYFISKNSTIIIVNSTDLFNTIPMFFITNTIASLLIENTTLVFGSNLLMNVKGTEEWGEQGKNGGEVYFNSTLSNLEGILQVDNISFIEAYIDDYSNIIYDNTTNITINSLE